MRRRCTLRRAALAFLVHGAAAQDPLAGFGGGDAYGAPPPQPMAPGPGGPPGIAPARGGGGLGGKLAFLTIGAGAVKALRLDVDGGEDSGKKPKPAGTPSKRRVLQPVPFARVN